CAVGVLGGSATSHRPPADPLASRGLRRYLLASVAATGAAHFALNWTVVSAQGRHWFATAPQLALLLALGIDRIAASGRRMRMAALWIAAALVALDVYCLLCVLAPAYEAAP